MGEVGIGLAEVPTAEEASAGREWRRMGCLEDEMTSAVNHRSLTPSGCPPEEEDYVLPLAVDRHDHLVGEGLPA